MEMRVNSLTGMGPSRLVSASWTESRGRSNHQQGPAAVRGPEEGPGPSVKRPPFSERNTQNMESCTPIHDYPAFRRFRFRLGGIFPARTDGSVVDRPVLQTATYKYFTSLHWAWGTEPFLADGEVDVGRQRVRTHGVQGARSNKA